MRVQDTSLTTVHRRLPAGPQQKGLGIGDSFQLAYFLDFISRVLFSQLKRRRKQYHLRRPQRINPEGFR
ncbi:rCG63644, partial [Rattus norvegicus]